MAKITIGKTTAQDQTNGDSAVAKISKELQAEKLARFELTQAARSRKAIDDAIKRYLTGILLVKDRSEDSQPLLAGYLNFDWTSQLNDYVIQETGPLTVLEILNRHNVYRDRNFGTVDKSTRS